MKVHVLILAGVLAVMAGPAALADLSVSGPAGLGVQKLEPKQPFFEHILTNNRLNLRLYLTNGTGRSLTFDQGSAVFRNAAGAVVRTAPLNAEEFARRSKLLSAPNFAGGPVLDQADGFTGEKFVTARLDAQNRLVAVGGALEVASGEYAAILARYTTNGVRDASFSGGNLLDIGPGFASALALDLSNNIVVVGTLLTGDGYFKRTYDPNGNAINFRTGTFPAPTATTSVAIDSQGRVAIGGYTQVNGAFRFFVARYTATGVPDLNFGNAGTVITDLIDSTSEGINALAIDSSNRIVAAGWATVGGASQFAVVRYLANNGGLDTSFSTDGLVLSSIPGFFNARVHALKISPSGRILAGGEASSGTARQMAIARYNSDGTPDANFSSDGFLSINLGTESEWISSIALDPIGRIVLTGFASNTEEEKMAIVRLNGIGQFDTAFSSDGQLLADGPDKFVSASARAVMLLPGDDIVVAGYAESDDDHADTRFLLARFRPSGSEAVLPIACTNQLDLLDFPFYAALDGQNWQDFIQQLVGFDSKHTPVRLDLTLQFLEDSTPLVVNGIPLSVYEQNSKPLRLPLGPPPALSWSVNDSRLLGTVHGGSRSQRFAYDLSVRIGENLALDPGRDPDALGLPALYESLNHPDYDPDETYAARDFSECYYAYGQPVLAIAPGTVVCVETNSLDNFPVGGNHQPGNGVTILHGDREYAAYQHLARASVMVKPGDTVQVGTPIGLLGNSGSSSGPHLHLHYTRLDDGAILDCAGGNPAEGRPTYYNNVFFPSTAGGPSVRQLRSAIPPFTPFAVDTNPVPSIIGLVYGPGAVVESGAHDTLAGPMRLQLPVTVQANVARATGTNVADAGDTIEDVYRFNLSQGGTLSAQLYWDNDADLDMIVYDLNLQPVSPAAAKTLAKPERLCLNLEAGSYFLFVTLYDPAAGASAANYQLELGLFTTARDIYVDRGSTCQFPFGNLSCNANWGGPYPTVTQGVNAVCPGSHLFIHGGTYVESIVVREPVTVRAYGGTAVINP